MLSLKDTHSGLPQGSILGPLQYMSDPFNICDIVEFITHAHDMSIFLNGTNSDDIITSENNTLLRLMSRVDFNELIISPHKAKAVFSVR